MTFFTNEKLKVHFEKRKICVENSGEIDLLVSCFLLHHFWRKSPLPSTVYSSIHQRKSFERWGEGCDMKYSVVQTLFFVGTLNLCWDNLKYLQYHLQGT